VRSGGLSTLGVVELFGDRLAGAVERTGSRLVVGLDPVIERLPGELTGSPAERAERFCCEIVDAVAPHVVAVKPQSAFFEALGWEGVRAFEAVCRHARAAGSIVIADAKRGDIGSTAEAYAQAFFPLADALTVNPYLGGDALAPFFERCASGAGVFCLVKTSNPGGGDVQDLVWEHVADLVRAWGEPFVGSSGISSVGAVVGATYPREVAEARARMPQTPLLLPGIGAQGGDPVDVAVALAGSPGSALVSASRSVIYADGEDWRAAAAAAARDLAAATRAAAGVA
jgi:orotidine-5'-phosphate decarboxylase